MSFKSIVGEGTTFYLKLNKALENNNIFSIGTLINYVSKKGEENGLPNDYLDKIVMTPYLVFFNSTFIVISSTVLII